MASAGTDGVRPGFTKRLDCITTMQFDITGPESAASPIGLINLEMKPTGKPGAGNPHAGFDEAGTGNGDTDNSKRARMGKPGYSQEIVLTVYRASSRPYRCICHNIL